MTRLTPVNDGAAVLLGRYLGCRPGHAASDRLRQDQTRPQVGCSRVTAASAGPAVATAGQDDPGGVRRAGQLGGE